MGFDKVNTSNVIGGRARVMIAATTYTTPGQLSELFNLTTYVANATYGWVDIGETKSASRVSVEATTAQWTGEQSGTFRRLITDWRGTANFEMMELTQDHKARVLGAVIQTDPVAGQHRTNWSARNAVPYVRLAFARLDPDGRLHATVIPRAQWDGSALQRTFTRGESESLQVNEAFYPDENQVDAQSGDFILCYDLDSD